jgi:sterol desaturase/sphingolipid hydroxylase (fatty acid hydroxylase superfamily)
MIGFALGVASWTLAEYVLHRVLGHDRRTWPNPFADEHTRHHSRGNYFAPAWKKALVAGGTLVAVAAIAALVVGPQHALAYGAGFAAMYVAYEVVHRRIHTHRGIGAYGRWLRRHHFHHHFANPRANHGVTSPLWDFLFGTLEAPSRVRVPAKLAMTWLVDGTGAVHADLAAHYDVVVSR